MQIKTAPEEIAIGTLIIVGSGNCCNISTNRGRCQEGIFIGWYNGSANGGNYISKSWTLNEFKLFYEDLPAKKYRIRHRRATK